MKTAWEMIGFDGRDGRVRVAGGRALYEAVMFNDDTRGDRVILARLDVTPHGLKAVTRYVNPDTLLEFVPDGGSA